MSVPTEDVLLNALNHEIRREILKLLKDGNKTYTQLLNNFVIPTGKLNYHLRLLEGLIEKNSDNYYQLTSFGLRAWGILEKFRMEISDGERPLLRQAYLSQKKEENSYLRLIFVSRMNFKFYILIIIGVLIILFGIYYISTGGTSPIVFAEFFLGVGLMIAGIFWINKIRKTAPDFVSKMDRVLSQLDKEEK